MRNEQAASESVHVWVHVERYRQLTRECTVLSGRNLPKLFPLLANTHKSIICGLFIASVYFCSDKTADICQGKFFAEIFDAENEALLTQSQDDKVKSQKSLLPGVYTLVNYRKYF